MEIYYNLQKQQFNTAVALGYFDGVHIAHRKIISKTVNFKNQGLIPTVFTFLNNPKSTLYGKPEQQITSLSEKKLILQKLGIEVLYAVEFLSIYKFTSEDFVKNILKDTLNAKAVVCGFNYHFGYNGVADVSELKVMCKKHNIKVKIIEPILYKHKLVSSTRIRGALKLNDVKSANEMLDI